MPRPSWIGEVIRRLNVPDDFANSLGLDLWAQSEGMPSDWFNWLAYTGHTSGCYAARRLPDGSSNRDGVDYCPSHEAGVLNTVAMLSSSPFSHVLYFMHTDYSKDKLYNIWLAINQSAACGGCQNGHYPVRLYQYLHGHGAPPTLIDRARAASRPEKPVPAPVSMFNGWAALIRALHHGVPTQLKRGQAERSAITTVVKYRARPPRKP